MGGSGTWGEEEVGRGGCSVGAAEPGSHTAVASHRSICSTEPVQSALVVQVVITVTSAGMGSAACIPGLEVFQVPLGICSCAVVPGTKATNSRRWVPWWPHGLGELVQPKRWVSLGYQ